MFSSSFYTGKQATAHVEDVMILVYKSFTGCARCVVRVEWDHVGKKILWLYLPWWISKERPDSLDCTFKKNWKYKCIHLIYWHIHACYKFSFNWWLQTYISQTITISISSIIVTSTVQISMYENHTFYKQWANFFRSVFCQP